MLNVYLCFDFNLLRAQLLTSDIVYCIVETFTILSHTHTIDFQRRSNDKFGDLYNEQDVYLV